MERFLQIYNFEANACREPKEIETGSKSEGKSEGLVAGNI